MRSVYSYPGPLALDTCSLEREKIRISSSMQSPFKRFYGGISHQFGPLVPLLFYWGLDGPFPSLPGSAKFYYLIYYRLLILNRRKKGYKQIEKYVPFCIPFPICSTPPNLIGLVTRTNTKTIKVGFQRYCPYNFRT